MRNNYDFALGLKNSTVIAAAAYSIDLSEIFDLFFFRLKKKEKKIEKKTTRLLAFFGIFSYFTLEIRGATRIINNT